MAIDTLYPQELLKKAALDSSRPKYHFSPPAAWMNDPNGLVFFKGKYHLFHQCNPLSPNPGRMGWGHAISNDGGVHWSYEPLALIPDSGFNEETASLPDGGCFTGCPVVKDDKLYLIYTNSSTGENGEVSQIQRIAVSEDGYTFKKIPTPIIDCFPPEGSEQFRDPKVWRHGEQWYCVIGSCKDGLGNVLLYRSIDLYQWEYVGEMLRANSVEEHGWMWECPSFFTIDDTDFLLISPMGLEEKGIICGYFIGKLDYDTGKFKADSFHNLCHSPEFYSAQVYTPEGYDTPVLIGWMQHWIVPEYPTKKCGWNGVHSLHYACGYDKDSGRLTLNPVPRIHSLRQNALHLSEGADPLLGVNCDAFELDISVDFHEAKENAKFDLYLRCNNDGNEYTCVLSQKLQLQYLRKNSRTTWMRQMMPVWKPYTKQSFLLLSRKKKSLRSRFPSLSVWMGRSMLLTLLRALTYSKRTLNGSLPGRKLSLTRNCSCPGYLITSWVKEELGKYLINTAVSLCEVVL